MSKYKYAPYSYSKITLFQKCPFAWKCAYIDYREAERHPSLIVGEMVHKILQEYLVTLRNSSEQSNHPVLDNIVQKYAKNNPEYADEIAEYLPAMKNVTFPPVEKAGIELKLGLDEGFGPADYKTAFFRGKVDFTYRIEDRAVVIDWKTNRNLPDQQIIEKDIQTRLYALMVSAFAPVESFIVELNFLRYRVIRKLEIRREELEPLKEWIMTGIEPIESASRFDPTPGEWCGLCGYKTHCPECRAVTESLPSSIPASIDDDDDAKRLAGMLKLVIELRNKLQSVLKEWVEKNGPIDLSGEVLDLYEYETYKWSTAEQKSKLCEVLIKAGISRTQIWDIFSTNKTAVCSLLRKHRKKESVSEVLATGEKSTFKRLDFKKKQEQQALFPSD